MTSPPLRSVSLGALLDTDLPERQWLMEPWLREQESALIWAAAGVGKTMLTLSLALAMAGGGSLLGWSAPAPRRVLVIDGEMPLDDLKGRMEVLLPAIQGIDLEAARGSLTILARHQQDPETAFPDFGAVDEHDAILALIRAHAPDAVILDNLSTLASLEDENGAAETQRIVRLLARLKQAKIAVIVVHHSGKSGASFRGSSMLATTFEAIIGLTKDGSEDVLDPTGSAKFQLRWDKFRGRRDASIGNREVALRTTFRGLEWTSQRPEQEVLSALAALVRTARFATRQEAGEALPPHLWPTPDKKPSTGWVSGKFALMDATGFLPRRDVDALLKAAREGGGDLGDLDDPHPDL